MIYFKLVSMQHLSKLEIQSIIRFCEEYLEFHATPTLRCHYICHYLDKSNATIQPKAEEYIRNEISKILNGDDSTSFASLFIVNNVGLRAAHSQAELFRKEFITAILEKAKTWKEN